MNCLVCNRPMKSQKSIKRGIGPVCEKKVKNQENEPPKGQTKIEDYLSVGEAND
ncbi:DUF6011 domain-containing protein [Metabacillus sp. HB246100]